MYFLSLDSDNVESRILDGPVQIKKGKKQKLPLYKNKTCQRLKYRVLYNMLVYTVVCSLYVCMCVYTSDSRNVISKLYENRENQGQSHLCM